MRNKGMSLVEIIVVVAIMSILIGVAGYGLSLSSGKPAEECARRLVSEIEQARMATMGRNKTEIIIYADNGGQDGVRIEEVSTIVNDDGSTTSRTTEKKVSSKKLNVSFSTGEDNLPLEFDRASGALKGNKDIVEIYISKANTKRTIKIYGLTGNVELLAE